MYGVGVPVPPVPYFYAFFDLAFIGAGSGIKASIYSEDGAWISDRATEASLDSLTNLQSRCIVGDPNELVGDGSLLVSNFELGDPPWQTVRVWDAEAETVYEYTASGDLSVSVPFYLNGFVYWWEWRVEYPALTTLTYTFMRARTDLTNVVTVGSTTLPGTYGPAVWGATPNNTTGVQLSSAAGRLYSSSTGLVRVTLAGVGSNGGGSPTSFDVEYPHYAIPNATGAAIGPGQDSPMLVSTAPVDLTDDYTPQWPQSGNWALQWASLGTFATSADRLTAIAYGGNGSAPWAVVAPCNATTGEPTKALEIQAHPDHGGEAPQALFLMT